VARSVAGPHSMRGRHRYGRGGEGLRGIDVDWHGVSRSVQAPRLRSTAEARRTERRAMRRRCGR